MKKIGYIFVMLWALYAAPAFPDQLSIEIGTNLQEYPELVAIPDYPVYYAPRVEANYFFYDGQFWLYQFDNWYRSSWYDDPWWKVEPEEVPDFILRIPVRYYLQPPIYFLSWWSEDAPHWGEHWGPDWEQHRHDWDKWDHRAHLKLAPLPEYQREYFGDRYPRQAEQQHELHTKNYHYHSHAAGQQQRHQPSVQGTPALQGGAVRIQQPRTEGAAPVVTQHAHPPAQEHKQQPKTENFQHDQQKQKAPEKESGRGREQERGRER